MTQKSKLIVYLTVLLVVSYLIIDSIHFFRFRITLEEYHLYPEACYESISISFIKWAFSIFIIVGIVLDYYAKPSSFYMIYISSIGILLLFIQKGPLTTIMTGSIAFMLGFFIG